MEAVVLAGGTIPPSLQSVTDAPERALIEIEGQTMLDRVLDSLRAVPPITRIICVATPQALASLGSDITGIPATDKLTMNLMAGAREAKSDRILIVTADVPLVTGRTWMQFMDGAAVNLLDAAYPIVKKETIEAQFPGGTRTYGHLKDGIFTGGNAFILPRNRLEALEELIDKAFSARKNPFALARMLGGRFIFRALTKKLTIGEVEEKISRLLGCRGGAVIIPDGAIAFDVDKPTDLQKAREIAAIMAQDAQKTENLRSR